jgi:hypothetical protein
MTKDSGESGKVVVIQPVLIGSTALKGTRGEHGMEEGDLQWSDGIDWWNKSAGNRIGVPGGWQAAMATSEETIRVDQSRYQSQGCC